MTDKSITEKDVEYVAKLARLQLSSQEKEKYTIQLEKILGYVGKLKEIKTDNVVPTAHPLDVSNAMRKDEAKPFSQISALLKNAPETEDTYYKVKKVIE